jgi:hypothetical protein
MHRAATTCYLYGSMLAPGTRLAGQNWCRLHSASAKRDGWDVDSRVVGTWDGRVGVAGTRALDEATATEAEGGAVETAWESDLACALLEGQVGM